MGNLPVRLMRFMRGSLAEAELTFEQALKRFEEIVEALETEDLDLEKSLQFFEEGVKLYRYCDQQLQAADRRIDLIQPKADGTLAAEPFVLRDDPPNSNGETNPTS